jgi:spore germination protein YaaH/flagellar hook assembly protein FlgD
MPGSQPARRRRAPVARSLLVAVMLAGLLPMPAAIAVESPIARPPVAQADAAPPEQQPSIAYLEAMAHEDDAIEFKPGGLVEVGFTPRAGDRWPIDGQVPGALPPGQATGQQMAASDNGSQWADTKPSDSGDGVGGQDPAASAAPSPTADPSRTPELPAPDDSTQSPGPPDSDAPVDPAAVPDATPAPVDAPVDAPASDPATPAQGASLTDPVEPTFDPAAASGLRRQVFGFLPYWELSGASTKLNYDVLSTVAYFSVGATSKGNLKKKDADGTSTTGWGGWTSSSMTGVINAAHQRGTRVVLTVSVFAWTSAQASVQKAILGSATARQNLARQAAAAVRDRGADGVNLDFEPLASGYADEFVAFLRTMRKELNRVRSGYQLTYDTTGFIGNYPLEASVAAGAADAIFVMGYDYRTSGSGSAGSIDPLSGPKYDLTDTVRAYTARVKPSRVILGLPWYGRAWSTTSDDVQATTQSGAKYGYSTAVNYESVTDLVRDHGRRWDPVEQSPYVVYRRENCTSTYGCVTSWRQVYYDDGASLKLRLGMVNEYGLRGAGMWALGYDGGHPELYRAIAESFLVDKSAPQAGIKLLSTAQADEGFVVTWAAEDVSRVVSYDVQVSVNGGAWTTWLSGTKATSDVWLGRDGTGYAFRVRARDSKGNTGVFNATSTWDPAPTLASGGFGRVVTDGLSYRTGPDTSAARLGTLDAGTIVAVTRGPVSRDGATWYEVTQPIREWNPVTFVERGVWVATTSSGTTHVAAYRAPNSTRVNAGLVGLDFGRDESALGTTAAARASRSFSPDGDGSKDELRLRWTNTAAMDSLVLMVHRPDGSLVGSTPVPQLAAGGRAFDWNGRAGGSRLPDGQYVLQLVGADGGRTFSAPSARPVTPSQVARYAVTIDTVAPKVASASATATLISPNGDGVLDRTRLGMTATGATRWNARVSNGAGTVVRSASGTGSTATLAWAGTDEAGKRVPDGRYTVVLAGYDDAGNPAVRTWVVTVDTAGPAVTPKATPSIFSPNRDGAADTTALSWAANEKGTGTARIYRGTTLIRSWAITSRSSWSAVWNGRKASGAAVSDGRYTFKVTLKDAAGNRRSASTPVIVDRTAGTLRWSRSFFPQDSDGIRPTAGLTWRLTRSATTTLGLYDAGGTLVRTIWNGRAQAEGARSWTWNGRLSDGTFVPQGRYTARLTVRSSLGTQVLERPVWVAGFAITPSATKVAPGQKLTIRFVSVESLTSRPTVTFNQPGHDSIKVGATRLSDGSYRAVFTVKTGPVGAASVKVAATDSEGGVNSTTVAIVIGAR